MTKLKSGRQLGRWILNKRIGKGGNGEVWTATHDDGRAGALKILHEDYQDPDHKRFKRFRDEIKMQDELTKAAKPGVLPIIDYLLPDNPSPSNPSWLVTEIAIDMRKALGSDANLLKVAQAVSDIAETLANLHADGISHRDIKPNNLFMLDGRCLLGDFGLVDFPDKEELTGSTEKLGPLHFIAPEMLFGAGKSDGRQADVYSLAKTLWSLGTGNSFPPPGELRHDSAQLRLSSFVKYPKANVLDRLIGRATAHDPAGRPSMADFATEIRIWGNPPTLRVSGGKLDWSGLGERLKLDRDRYEDECRERARMNADDHVIEEELRNRMEQLMTDWSAKLGVGLNCGGMTNPPISAPPNARSVCNASVHLCSPRPEYGCLTGWIGVYREGTVVMHARAAVGIFSNASTNVLWQDQFSADDGSATYAHRLDDIFVKLKKQFENNIVFFVQQL